VKSKKKKQEGPLFLSKCENKANKVCKKTDGSSGKDTSYNYADDKLP